MAHRLLTRSPAIPAAKKKMAPIAGAFPPTSVVAPFSLQVLALSPSVVALRLVWDALDPATA